jgi:drug/metabolite transporter (DMT)-like permease
MEGRPDRLTLSAFAVLAAIGGANSVGIRFSNRELAPFWGAGLRFALAGLVFFGIVWARRIPLPRGRALLGTLIFGALGFGLSYALVYWGLLEVPAGFTQIILASVPLLTFFFAVLHGQEAFGWRPLAGALVALAGIGVMFRAPVTPVPFLPFLAIVGTAASIAESTVVARQFPKVHLAAMNAVAMIAGAALLLVTSGIVGEPRALPTFAVTWIAFGYLVLVGSVAIFALFLFILKRWTASATSFLFVLFPISAVALSAWLEGEPLTPALLLGGVLVLLGVYVGALATTAPRNKASVAADR